MTDNSNNCAGRENEATPIKSGVFPFFKLPRELRDQIYDELWKSDPIVTFKHHVEAENAGRYEKYFEFKFTTRYNDSADPSSSSSKGPPTWLLLSKTVLEEGLEQTYRNSTLAWTSISISSHVPPGMRSSVLEPSTFRWIEISTAALCCFGGSFLPRTGVSVAAPAGLSFLSTFTSLDIMASIMTPSTLKHLRLRTKIWDLEKFLNPAISWTVDLSDILTFPHNIEKFEFVVFVPMGQHLGGSPVESLLKQEIGRVGCLLVGGQANQRFEEKALGHWDSEWTFGFIKDGRKA